MSRNFPVLRLQKILTSCPRHESSSVAEIRDFQREDVERWLRIHNRTSVAVRKGRPWDAADFGREFRSWFDPSSPRPRCAIWLADVKSSHDAGVESVGTICCKFDRSDFTATLNWLAVEEAWRRQGIAGQLLRRAELYCWHAGVRKIELSTLDSWRAAVAFYRRHGYANLVE